MGAPGGGGGRTRVIENGAVFEKGGVNISAVHGNSESMKSYFKVKAGDFFACGLSMVIHPKNPFVPTVHANWRILNSTTARANCKTNGLVEGKISPPTTCLKKMPDTFTKYARKLVMPMTKTSTLNTKNAVMNIFGMPTEVKPVGLADCFLII